MDDRANFTKADWQMWIAALGNEDQVHLCMCDEHDAIVIAVNGIILLYVISNSLQFNAITDKVYKFVHETEDRHPFPDWYVCHTPIPTHQPYRSSPRNLAFLIIQCRNFTE